MILLSRENRIARDAEVARLWNHEKLTQIAIADRLNIPRGTAAQILHRLRAQNLVELRPHPGGHILRAARDRVRRMEPSSEPKAETREMVKVTPLPPRPAPKPEPITEDENGELPVDRMRALAEAKGDTGCKYIAGEPRDHRYCGKQRRDVLAPYCEEHMAVCYTKRIHPYLRVATDNKRNGNGFVKRLPAALEEVM